MVFTLGRRDFLAVVIGSGDEAPRLRALADELNIADRVWFTGRISDEEALRYLSTMTICVQPDPLNALNDKSTMNKMMEYMALGKAIVAFDLVETRFSAQSAARYVSPNDEREFAKEVCNLLDDQHARDAMGASGAARFRDQLAWEYSKHELLRAYETLLGARESNGLRRARPTD
jgi:glycosyltransferase involved in cell wall biosynthesis